MNVSGTRRLVNYYRPRYIEERKKGKLHLARVIAYHLALSLFYWLGTIKVERLYDRYLTDRATADDFRKEYLPEQFQNESGLVLDFGCGRGRHCAMLSQCGFKVVGMDPTRHDYWQKIPSVQFLLGSNRELKLFKDDVFDLCLSFLVLTYIQDDKETVGELARVTRKRGWLVLQIVNQDNLRTIVRHRHLGPQMIHQYTIEEAVSMLKKAGFRVERLWTEQFYSPFLTTFFIYLFGIILPHQVMDYASRHTPPRYRGVINIMAQKV